jgi:lantibiotic biosynthesis protein
VTSIDAETGEFLMVANAIGRRISKEAVWHDDRCNWVGAEPLERSNRDVPAAMTYRALSPDLYSGTSGVALFLAELHAVTGDHEAHRTSLGAIQQALSRVDAIPPRIRLGLFTGWVGVAFAAARVGIVLAEPTLLERATQLLRRSASEPVDDQEFDLISGRAGAIAALLVLHHILDDASLLRFAVRLGDELLNTANKADIGYSWKSSGLRNQHNLTGFSHGTAGAAYALLELFSATGEARYLETARLAFQYERHWFDSKVGNWPDFREYASSNGRERSLSFSTFWCHGAPGIALSRLRAYEVLNDEMCRAEAIIALNTTCKSIESTLYAGTGNFSLCHGQAGNAEALLYASKVLGREHGYGLSLVLKIANAGIERYVVARQGIWACGTHSGETPNLMLGLAGIGHFYLRLHHWLTPSILILRKEAFESSNLSNHHVRRSRASHDFVTPAARRCDRRASIPRRQDVTIL